MQIRLGLLAIVTMTLVSFSAQAAPISFKYTAVDGLASINGGTPVAADLTIDLFGDTDNFLADVGLGARGYNDLSGSVSSSSFGLSNVAITNTISLFINSTVFGAAFENSVFMQVDGAGNQGGVFLPPGPEFSTYDGVSDLAPVLSAAGFNGPLSFSLSNGSTLVVTNLDNEAPFIDATFSATAAVPLPGAFVLLLTGIGVAGFAGARARRRAEA